MNQYPKISKESCRGNSVAGCVVPIVIGSGSSGGEGITKEVDPTVPDWAKQPDKPTYSLSELTQDEQHQTVSAEEKERWNNPSIGGIIEEFDPTVPDWAKQPNKPSYALSELTQDDQHQTVTAEEKAYWNSLPVGGGGPQEGFSGDYNDLINQPTIPTTLAELAADDSHQTVSAAEKDEWNNKLSIQQNVENSGKIFTIDIDGKTTFKSLAELHSGLTWGMLAGRE